MGLQDQVIQAAAKAFVLPAEQLSLSSTSKEVEGWDSMAHLHFITLLENQFDIRFSTADIMVMNSVQTAVDKVKNYQK